MAVPLFAALSPPLAIAVCALVMVAVGVLGLWRYGLREPALAPTSTPSARPQTVPEMPM